LKILSLIAGVLIGAALVYGSLDMPTWGDPHSPASTHVSPYYLRHSIEDTATPNVVTSVLADYRGYDTLGETTVVFTAGMACILLLRKRRKRQGN
jgi:multicomponent Na+:H+ antiporter subunit B